MINTVIFEILFVVTTIYSVYYMVNADDVFALNTKFINVVLLLALVTIIFLMIRIISCDDYNIISNNVIVNHTTCNDINNDNVVQTTHKFRKG